jgi:hypothetical protein
MSIYGYAVFSSPNVAVVGQSQVHAGVEHGADAEEVVGEAATE